MVRGRLADDGRGGPNTGPASDTDDQEVLGSLSRCGGGSGAAVAVDEGCCSYSAIRAVPTAFAPLAPTSTRPRNFLTTDLPVDVLELADPTNN